MSTLKEKFENYSVQPDEKVWKSIETTLHERKTLLRRRRIAVVAASAVVVGTIAVVAVLGSVSNAVEAPAIAQQTIVRSAPVEENTLAAPQTAEQATVQTPRPAGNEAVATQVLSAPLKATTAEAVETPAPAAQQPIVAAQNKDEAIHVAEVPQSKPATQQPAPTKAVAQATKQETGVDNDTEQPTAKVSRQPQKAANDELVVWIPNAFAPDDPNDEVRTFKAKPNSEANLISFEIFIYSRSGRMVYHSKDINEGWDGVANGHAQPMGTYVYIVEINDAVKGIQHKKGTITLIR